MAPTATSELIFSEQANHNFSKTLGDLKRSTLSIHNRLKSIEEDAAFARQVQTAYGRPLIANERCGSWYIEPSAKSGSAYFKSTDGHTGVWKFSSRRLNLHLLDTIGKHDGCIIIDSTRRGKRMPDALSKTIPIWCSVINRVLFSDTTASHELYTPPQVISSSENAQIVTLLPSFAHALLALDIRLDSLRSKITKPLRPIWVTPESNIASTKTIFQEFHPIICCTVSRRVAGGELSEGGYIQGAGDDTENWAYGLTPTTFWLNRQVLLSTPDADLPELIECLARQAVADGTDGQDLCCISPTTILSVTHLAGLNAGTIGSGHFTIALLPKVIDKSLWQASPTRLDIGLGPHKVGSRNLRTALPYIMSRLSGYLSAGKSSHGIMIACENGKDCSIGVALAILCLLFDDAGQIMSTASTDSINKTFIRSRMSWISTSLPDANPNRTTLQSVNSFLMERLK